MNRIKELRKARGMKQIELCARCGVSQGALSGWENGHYEPDATTWARLADIFNVSIGYIMGTEDSSFPSFSSSDPTTVPPTGENWVPVLGRVRAGIPIDAVEEILDYEQLDPATARRGKHIGLKVVGDSMEPRFAAGDVVIVRLQPDIESGQIGIVLVNGDEATIKRVIKQDDGILLVATNPAYPPRFFSKKEMTTLPVTILGKVVELRAKF